MDYRTERNASVCFFCSLCKRPRFTLLLERRKFGKPDTHAQAAPKKLTSFGKPDTHVQAAPKDVQRRAVLLATTSPFRKFFSFQW